MQKMIQIGEGIDSFQRFLEELYRPANENHSHDYVLAYLFRCNGYLSKKILEGTFEDQDLIRSLSWLFTLAAKCDVGVGDAFIDRYPGLCPSCLGAPCVCFRTRKRPAEYQPAHRVRTLLKDAAQGIRRRRSQEGFDFDWAIRMLDLIYPNNAVVWHYAGPYLHFTKLGEETAKLHEAISGNLSRGTPRTVITEKIAGTFAWLLGVWQILRSEASLDGELISYYMDGCPVCHQMSCVCDSYTSRITGLIDVQKLHDIKDNLDRLANILPESRESFSDVIQSLEVAAHTQDEAVARLSVAQTSDKLQAIQKKIATADDIGKKGASIMNTLQKLVESFSGIGIQ